MSLLKMPVAEIERSDQIRRNFPRKGEGNKKEIASNGVQRTGQA